MTMILPRSRNSLFSSKKIWPELLSHRHVSRLLQTVPILIHLVFELFNHAPALLWVCLSVPLVCRHPAPCVICVDLNRLSWTAIFSPPSWWGWRWVMPLGWNLQHLDNRLEPKFRLKEIQLLWWCVLKEKSYYDQVTLHKPWVFSKAKRSDWMMMPCCIYERSLTMSPITFNQVFSAALPHSHLKPHLSHNIDVFASVTSNINEGNFAAELHADVLLSVTPEVLLWVV